MDQQTQVLPVLVCVLGLAGNVVWHLQGRVRPTARLVVQIAFFAAMTAAEIVGEGRSLANLMIIKNGVVAIKSGEKEIARLAANMACSPA